jgi:hypothetical protein
MVKVLLVILAVFWPNYEEHEGQDDALQTWLLRILVVVVGALGAVSLMPALFACMLLDAPGSNKPASVAFVLAVMSFPFTCFRAVWGASASIAASRLRDGLVWLLFPLASIVVAAGAGAWIVWFQNGKFNG